MKTILQRVLDRRGISTLELAAQMGRTVGTLHNLGCKNSRSRRLREDVTLFLGETIWPDVPVKKFTIPAGTVLSYSREEDARHCKVAFGDAVAIADAIITFRKTEQVVWIPSKPPRKTTCYHR